MKKIKKAFIMGIILCFSGQIFGQVSTNKKFSAAIGAGYFNPILTANGVTYANATFDPQTGPGLSYFASFDYKVINDFYLGLGFNGNFAGGQFIKDAVVEGSTVTGYLEAGTVANSHIMLNVTYAPQGEGIKPYAKLGIGYFTVQVEMGDVPLELTGNVETELFPDYKYNGFGAIPELGVGYRSFTLSAAYNFPFGDLIGEEVAGSPPSVGSITSHGLQINLSYRIYLF